MTANLLAADLALLVQESKRRNTDIKSAAEKSLADLKALPHTSESQLAADLRRKPNFVRPFLLSCASKNPKYAGTAIACLQRLVVSNGLAQETLKDVLDVLRDCTGLGVDIQLRILQVLPSLVQNFADQLSGELLVVTLHICFLLLATKHAVTSNTAAATLQQLVVSVLGKVAKEDTRSDNEGIVSEVAVEDGTIPVHSAGLDAYYLLNDLCLMTEGQKPQFLLPTPVSVDFGLELLEAMLSNHSTLLAAHPELVHILRIRLMPFVIRILSEKVAFSTTVRAMRLLPIIFSSMLTLLATECEMIFGLLNHMLDPDAALPWKRVLCLEVFRIIHADSVLVRKIYSNYDEQEGKRNIIRDHLATLMHVAREKPNIIGLGQHSSIPSAGPSEEEVDEQAALQAEGVAATLGVMTSLTASNAPGLSVQFSSLKVACMDQLDKTEPPPLPPAYIYILVLSCVNNFAEGLARFLLPFSIPHDTKRRTKTREIQETDERASPTSEDNDDAEIKKARPNLTRLTTNMLARVPINPIEFVDKSLNPQIQSAANMVEHCWPSMLASYSTFLHAALDPEYYHSLIRAFQKFTQISGVLRLVTPRNAFLTALGKEATPASNSPPSSRDEGRVISYTGSNHPQQAPSMSNASLTTRNLLCLRALINLAIALGPILGDAWSIILETIQETEVTINTLTSGRSKRTRTGLPTSGATSEMELSDRITNEIGAAKLASARMLESSADLLDEAFLDLCTAFRKLVGHPPVQSGFGEPIHVLRSPHHRKQSSTSTISAEGLRAAKKDSFVVEHLNQVISHNASRLTATDPSQNGWNIITRLLLNIIGNYEIDPNTRIEASKVLDNMVSMTAARKDSPQRDLYRELGLRSLMLQVAHLYNSSSDEGSSTLKCDADIHLASLGVLRTNLERYGDSLTTGWPEVLKIIGSVFWRSAVETQPSYTVNTRSAKLVRASFGALQLCCTDFLASLPHECFGDLLSILQHFCGQTDDFNISLISTTLFCTVTDHMWESIAFHNALVYVDGNGSAALQSGDSADATPEALWIYAIFLLAENNFDKRIEIRHSALHSIFRILESAGNIVDSQAWISCQKRLAGNLFVNNRTMYEQALVSAVDEKEKNLVAVNETAILILTRFANLCGQNLPLKSQPQGYLMLWEEIVNAADGLLDRQILYVSVAIYTTFCNVLSQIIAIQDSDSTPTNSTNYIQWAALVWGIWKAKNPAEHLEMPMIKFSDNEAALLAYVHCMRLLHLLIDARLSALDIDTILAQLLQTITGASPTPFVMDVDNLTSLQNDVLSVIEQLCGSDSNLSIASISTVSNFVLLAYKRGIRNPEYKGPSYVAFSKAAMELLGNFTVSASRNSSLYEEGSLHEALTALNVPISMKYHWHLEGKAPSTWEKATLTVVDILTATVPILAVSELEANKALLLWKDVLTLYHSIVTADIYQGNATRPHGQKVDIAATAKIFDLLVPTLGSLPITDAMRRSFTSSIFESSLIHEPHPDDMPEGGREPLACLRRAHMGRVQDMPASPRSAVAYILLDKLFDLVAIKESSPEQIRLAQAAAPYLILRVGLALKTYVLDQPLRGRMPQPLSQKKEMIYVLRRLTDLQSEPQAMPDAPGIISKNRKHLFHLYRLITQALQITKSGTELHGILMKIVGFVADEFGT